MVTCLTNPSDDVASQDGYAGERSANIDPPRWATARTARRDRCKVALCRAPGGREVVARHRPLAHGVRPGRLVAAVVVALVALVAWSYVRALTGPGNDAMSIRSTEWLKNHYFTWAVNDVERWWYTHHQPKVGGIPAGALGRTMQSAATPHPPTTRPSAARVTAGRARMHLAAPAPIRPIAASPLPGEGEWTQLGQLVDGQAPMYAAFLRPDPIHTSLVTA